MAGIRHYTARVLGESLAVGQRSMGDPGIRYPLWPPLTAGCPRTSTDALAYPVEVDYDYAAVPPGFLDRPRVAGLERWAPLMPPLSAKGLAEGSTPLVELTDGVWIKDESRNPTWSHKDRLNRCAVSAAVGVGAPGVVVASSGNHGASAAAYAARAGLGCVVLLSAGAPPAVESFVRAYGAAVLVVPREARWPLLRRIVDELGYHPVSNLTDTYTGHPFGPEGYKTIAYELAADLGVPAAVFVPTGHAELLFGVWKGFDELRRIGATADVPRLFSCEPATGGPLARAMALGDPAATVPTPSTAAYAIGCSVGGVRGMTALSGRGAGGGSGAGGDDRNSDARNKGNSNGAALLVSEDELAAAQRELAGAGLWQEVSGAAGLAGYRQVADRRLGDGPVVCLATSSGFKDLGVGAVGREIVDPSWPEVHRRLREADLPGA